MADGTTKKVFDNQSILYALIDSPIVQSLYLSPESALKFPQRLVNDGILKNCIPGEETNITRNSYSDMHLFYLKQAIFAALVPDIKLYKVKRTTSADGKTKKKEIVEIEMPKSLGEEYFQRNAADLEAIADVQNAIGEALESLGSAFGNAATPPPTFEEQLARRLAEISGVTPPTDPASGPTLSEKIRSLTPPANDFDLSRPLLQRSGQIGIKSFEWNYVGQNPFSAERDIQATLTLTMDGLGALNAVRTNKKGQKYRILDIMIQADCFKKKGFQIPRPNEPVSQTNEEAEAIPSNQALKYDPGCYEVLIEAGYFVDDERLNKMIELMNLRGKSAIPFQDEEIQRALESIDFKKMKSCMYLNTTDHSFSFGENGKVDLTVNYVARSMSADRAPEANILFNDATQEEISLVAQQIETVEELIKKIESGEEPTVEKDIPQVPDGTELPTYFALANVVIEIYKRMSGQTKTTNLSCIGLQRFCQTIDPTVPDSVHVPSCHAP